MSVGGPSGEWLNYTRTFPTNYYYIYARLASDDGAVWRDRVTRHRR